MKKNNFVRILVALLSIVLVLSPIGCAKKAPEAPKETQSATPSAPQSGTAPTQTDSTPAPVQSGQPANTSTTVQPAKAASIENAPKAAPFALTDLSGSSVSLDSYKGKRLFLHFWSVNGGAKIQMAEIEKFYQETKGTDLVILAVNAEDSAEAVKQFVTANKINFKVLLDSGKKTAAQYDVKEMPTSFFIDNEGRVIKKEAGTLTMKQLKENNGYTAE